MNNEQEVFKTISKIDKNLAALEAKTEERHVYTNDKLNTIESKLTVIADKFRGIDSMISNKVLKVMSGFVAAIGVISGIIFWIANGGVK